MRRRLMLVTSLAVALLPGWSGALFAQTPDEQPAIPPVLEPTDPPLQSPQPDETRLSESTGRERGDAVFLLSELRGNVRMSPSDPEERLKLAHGLYRIGDFDAALDECRIALKFQPNSAPALLQLGLILMAKQDGHGAATSLMEAILIDPELTHAHYSLGGVQYTLGNIKAAIQSYRRALELQPHFPDARYRLALLLKLTNRHQEAAQLMEEAAVGGIAQAQFFTGNTYKSGQGVAKDLGRAVFWWTKAVAFGHQPAAETLTKLRRQALSADQTDRRRSEALDGFRAYRALLREEFPDYSLSGDSETVGTALLKDNRTDLAVAMLLNESYALSDIALAELVALYETGREPYPAPFDKKIFACIETLAADGFVPARKALARIYGRGLGLPPDRAKAKTALKGVPKQDARALLDELGLQ